MLNLQDTMTGEKRPLKTQEENLAKVYICGPTVYDYAHLGHARCFIVYDVLIRHLRASGMAVDYVRNITDVNDKILARAQEKGVSPTELARAMTEAFWEDMAKLRNLKPDTEPKVSEHITGIIAMIETLIEKGHAYEAEGDVYFAVRTMEDYGKLSHRKLDANEAGASGRLDEKHAGRKKDPADFALWKGNPEDEWGWPSPWGHGRPGWHIECSVMSTQHLGETLDLHGGGLDLVFPHHENEIAQSECATGCTFSNHWMHNGFVEVNKEKMGKSLGNFFTARELFAKHEPEGIRLWTMTVHYRSPLNLDWEEGETPEDTRFPSLEEAERRVAYLYTTRQRLDAIPPKRLIDGGEPPAEKLSAFPAALRAALDDDLNMPKGLAAMQEFLKEVNELCDRAQGKKGRVAKKAVAAAHAGFVALDAELGLGGQDPTAILTRIRDRRAKAAGVAPAEVEQKIADRVAARKAKDFEKADTIRDELAEKGVELHDGPEGTTWTMQ